MASRPANPRTPPRFALVAIVFAGVLVIAAGVLLALALRETPRGAAGTALVFAWLFTKHYFMSRNENLLHFDPLSLALVVLVPLSVYGMRGVSKALKLAGIVASLSLLGFVLQGIPLFNQKNGEIIALALPINLAVWWTVYRLALYRRTSLPSSAAL